jgi:hypothetical protein
MLSSMLSAISGPSDHQVTTNVTGDNVNTVGSRSAAVSFQDVLSQTVSGTASLTQTPDPGGDPGRYPVDSPQANALANPDAPYMLVDGLNGNLVSFTPTSARAWWDAWIAHPFDLTKVAPGALPGSLVLTLTELRQVQAINNAGGLPPPPAWEPPNPYTVGLAAATPAATSAASPTSSTRVPATTLATLRRYISNLSAAKHPTAAQRQELAIYRARLADYISRT